MLRFGLLDWLMTDHLSVVSLPKHWRDRVSVGPLVLLALCVQVTLGCSPSPWVPMDVPTIDVPTMYRRDDGPMRDGSSRADVLGDGSVPRAPMANCAAAAGPFRPLSTRCQHFVDSQRRVVFLRGINARVEGVFDVALGDGRTPVEPIPSFAQSDADRMRQLGYNVLRLPINWSGVEPTRGSYDDAYIDRVAAVVGLAKRAGMLVILEFHQDSYSKEIGEDGAPLWAIRPAPEMLLQGPITTEELLRRQTSPQVVHAFETFFSMAGEDLQRSYAAMTAHVAQRFVSNDSVLGYELFNEPIADDASCTAFNIQVARAIRAVDSRRLLFFQPPAVRNVLDQAPLASEPFPVAGSVYTPHIYTLSIGGSDSMRRSFTRDTLRVSHFNAMREAQAWGTPVFISEWGYDPSGIRMNEYVEYQQDLQDEFGSSSALWLWKERSQGFWGLFDYDAATDEWTERPAFRRALARVRPEAIAGWPSRWQYDRTQRSFFLEYTGSAEISAPSLIYVPAEEDFAPRMSVTCDGLGVTVMRDPATGLIAVPCNGPGMHRISVSALE